MLKLTGDSLPLPGPCELDGSLLHVPSLLSVAVPLNCDIRRQCYYRYNIMIYFNQPVGDW